jgi:hypothetical protein
MIVQLQARARRVPRGVRVSLCLRVRCQLSWAVAGSSKLHPRSMLPRPTRPVPVPVGRSRPRPAPQAPAAGRARRGGSAVSFHLSLPTRVATVRIDEAEGRAATAVARGSRTLAAGGRRARAGRWGDLTQCEPRHSGRSSCVLVHTVRSTRLNLHFQLHSTFTLGCTVSRVAVHGRHIRSQRFYARFFSSRVQKRIPSVNAITIHTYTVPASSTV